MVPRMIMMISRIMNIWRTITIVIIYISYIYNVYIYIYIHNTYICSIFSPLIFVSHPHPHLGELLTRLCFETCRAPQDRRFDGAGQPIQPTPPSRYPWFPPQNHRGFIAGLKGKPVDRYTGTLPWNSSHQRIGWLVGWKTTLLPAMLAGTTLTLGHVAYPRYLRWVLYINDLVVSLFYQASKW